MKRVKLKICGMNQNTEAVALLKPDYLGFIFWEPSKRCFTNKMPKIDASIKKVGVFVNAAIEEVLEKVSTYNLSAIQLHGKETPAYCKELQSPELEVIKVFSIKDAFDFSVLAAFEDVCDYFLFDTKGKLPGGNGYTFNWEVLKNYPSTKPYFLSGGIGLDDTDNILNFLSKPEASYCHALDINSKFEDAPGLKNSTDLENFISKIYST